jgi:hypothetical protein
MLNQTANPAKIVPLSALMRDLADGFFQQMFFWGRDVVHKKGNLLVSYGFVKRPSQGLQGTSCYSLPWQGGQIELHGSYAGWFGNDEGFLFIRPRGRCVRWLCGDPPIPGKWPSDLYATRADDAMIAVSFPFLDWWLDYENALAGQV